MNTISSFSSTTNRFTSLNSFISSIDLSVSNIALASFTAFGLVALLSPSFRNGVRKTARRIFGPPSKEVTIWRTTLLDPTKSVTKTLPEMAKKLTPQEMLEELEYCIEHMKKIKHVEETFSTSRPGRVFNFLRNKSLENKKITKLTDGIHLTKNPLHNNKTEDEIKNEKVSYYSAFLTKTVAYIPSSFIHLVDFVQDYPSQIVAILFGTLAPYTLTRLASDIKPLLSKLIGDIDDLLLNHSGKITLLFTGICFALYYSMRGLKNPSVTDYADEVRSGKVPHRGLDSDPAFADVITTARLCLKNEKFQPNTSIFIKSPVGTHPPIEETLQMFAEMSITGRKGFKEQHKFKKVSLNKILIESCGDQKILRRTWERIVQEYEHNENTFLYLEDFQNILLPIDKETKKKSDVQRLRDLVKSSVRSGKIRVVLSGDKDLESVLKKDPEYFKKFKVTGNPTISNVKKYISEVYNPIDQWDRIHLTSDAEDFISSIPTTLHQENRLPTEIEKAINAVMSEVETRKSNALLKKKSLRMQYDAIANHEGAHIEQLRELKEECLRLWWEQRQKGDKANPVMLKKLSTKLLLIQHVLLPTYAKILDDKLHDLNKPKGKKQSSKESDSNFKKPSPAKLPFEVDRQEAIKLFNRHYVNKVAPHALDDDKIRVDTCFTEHLIKAVPGRKEQIDDIYRAVRNWMDKDQGPNCKPAGVFVLAGPGGWGKTMISDLVAKELYHLLDPFNHHEKDTGIDPQNPSDVTFDYKNNYEHLNNPNATPNYINIDLAQNPWEGSHANQIIEQIKRNITEKPMGVYNFDEMDKIPKKKENIFLSMFDGRMMTYTPLVAGSKKEDKVEDTQSQQPVDRRNCFFFITVNLWDDNWNEMSYDEQKKELKEKFEGHFNKALGTRVTSFIPMGTLQQNDLKEYVKKYLETINQSFNEEYHITFDYTDAIDYFVDQASEKKLSLRELQELIEKTLNPLISKEGFKSRGYSDHMEHPHKLLRTENPEDPFMLEPKTPVPISDSFNIKDLSYDDED